VTVDITTDQDIDVLVLDEDFPVMDGTAGNLTNETIRLWNVTSVDSDGAIFKNSTAEWIWLSTLSGGENCTVVYNVTLPLNLTGGIYEISGNVSAYEVNATGVNGESGVYVMDDWNPWNDWDSEGSPNGRYITIEEVTEAHNYWRFSNPASLTGAGVTSERVIAMYNAWRFSEPM
jgi:hypothetical protein